MIEAYKNYWKHYADFEGRTDLAGYWWVFLVNFLIGLVYFFLATIILFVIGASVATSSSYSYYEASAGAVGMLFIFFVLIGVLWGLANLTPALAIQVRRLRDAGYHWAYVFLNLGGLVTIFIPLLGVFVGPLVGLGCSIALIVLCCQPTKQVNAAGSNYYGFNGEQPISSFQGQNQWQGMPNQNMYQQPNQGAPVQDPNGMGIYQQPNQGAPVQDPNGMGIYQQPNQGAPVQDPNDMGMYQQPNQGAAVQDPNGVYQQSNPAAMNQPNLGASGQQPSSGYQPVPSSPETQNQAPQSQSVSSEQAPLNDPIQSNDSKVTGGSKGENPFE
ncbi:DUF805 domain-containing protein [Streptococcus dentapri]|uniref:DUF805 domain-containing protein n=1 Tax=Streptococcus dentapri TaxID=573564 RepID=A0ABV8D2W2_9STRE